MSAGQQAGQVPRTLRAAVFAAGCVLLAALGHVLMSGVDVPWWAVIAALSGTGGCAWFLAGRERGPLLVTLATVGAQAGLHFFFTVAQNVSLAGASAGPATGTGTPSLLSGMLCGSNATAGTGMSGMSGHSGMSGMSGMDGMSGMAGMPAHDGMQMDMLGMHGSHGAIGMWSAHLLAALVLGVWLSGGEHAVFRVGRAACARLVAPLLVLLRGPLPTPGPPRVRAGLARAAQRLRQLLYAYALVTRGPPAPLAVCR
ncbi:hypothetical protein I5Q34_22225 [Streptomyces sp. AV19]|uniref:hypothetical protein n=1 Tax=Streptomyces sp. AV19 TaxID=2793068 RepID=UPI0018FF09DF|nr:hypothetical protein [Streptomyces sp. AV19]MBH1936951.1 hypothetical protein [Streptomyces sp. AV19]MDG4533005.1 hypothetical protein [Streptomyces sp. AV19]